MISGASDEELDIAIARANVLLELQPKIDELKKENQELKKQLEEKENQQKEFIEWLKYELDTSYTNSSRYYYFSIVLSKNNEIIGGKE